MAEQNHTRRCFVQEIPNSFVGVVVVVVVVVHLSSLFSGVAAAAVAVVFEQGGEALFGFLLERGVGGDGVFDDSLLGSFSFLLFFFFFFFFFTLS